MRRRGLIATIVLIAIIVTLLLLRVPILRSIGNGLIVEHEPEQVEYLFVLSGGAFDRGNEAAKLYAEGFAKNIVCTGENIPHDFKAIGMEMPESKITQSHIVAQGIPVSRVQLLPVGTSTFEESDVILNFCRKNGLNEIIVLSSRFHTRRISRVFVKKFRENEVRVIIRGAPSTAYEEREWWRSENGLIAVNNEYIKLGYYLVKY